MFLRNTRGDLVWAIADCYGYGTNTRAEVLAMFQGIQKCWEEGYTCVDAESDSLMLVDMLRGKLNPP